MNLDKTFIVIGVLVFLASVLLVFGNDRQPETGEVISSPNQVEIHYFLSRTCPYCRNQNLFWEEFLPRYPEVVLHRYYIEDRATADIFSQLAVEYDALRYAGTVPVTFVGDKYFVGFDNSEGIGRAIEEAVIAEQSRREEVIGDLSDNSPAGIDNSQTEN